MAMCVEIHGDSVDRARFGAGLYRRTAAIAVAAVAVGLAYGSPCRAAGLLVSAPAVTATAGTSGSFDVTITNTTGRHDLRCR